MCIWYVCVYKHYCVCMCMPIYVEARSFFQMFFLNVSVFWDRHSLNPELTNFPGLTCQTVSRILPISALLPHTQLCWDYRVTLHPAFPWVLGNWTLVFMGSHQALYLLTSFQWTQVTFAHYQPLSMHKNILYFSQWQIKWYLALFTYPSPYYTLHSYLSFPLYYLFS